VESSLVETTVPVVSAGKDSADQELFDFLNESSPSVNGSQKSDGRPSSSSSGRSQKTPELPEFVADVGIDIDHRGMALFGLYNVFNFFLLSDSN